MNFRHSFISRIISSIVVGAFCSTTILPPSFAQSINLLNLPVPGTIVNLSQPFVPVLLKGMTLHPDDPFRFDFIIDTGNTKLSQEELKKESERLVKYFLASMTVSKNDLWVNLSPYEKDRIVPDALGKTELGRDMLAQDYILKQLTASLMYPEKELGQKFWDKIRKIAKEKYGTDEIPMDTFNKVWIVPQLASVYEHGQTVYVAQTRLKVMLEEDYMAREASVVKQTTDKSPDYMKQIIREVIIPAIEKEVNEGENFAQLRQIYHSLILAKWYKETIKNSLLAKVYVDQNKVVGIENDDAAVKDKIYERYIEAFKKGVYNYIKEDYDAATQESIPRKYFSGGIVGDANITRVDLASLVEPTGENFRLEVAVRPEKGERRNQNVDLSTLAEGLNLIRSNSVMGVVEGANLLGEIKDQTAVPDLIELLNRYSGFPTARIAVIRALGKINDSRAIEPILGFIRDYDGNGFSNSVREEEYNAALETLIEMKVDNLRILEAHLSYRILNGKREEYALNYVLSQVGEEKALELFTEALRKMPKGISSTKLIEKLVEKNYRPAIPILREKFIETFTSYQGDGKAYQGVVQALIKFKDAEFLKSNGVFENAIKNAVSSPNQDKVRRVVAVVAQQADIKLKQELIYIFTQSANKVYDPRDRYDIDESLRPFDEWYSEWEAEVKFAKEMLAWLEDPQKIVLSEEMIRPTDVIKGERLETESMKKEYEEYGKRMSDRWDATEKASYLSEEFVSKVHSKFNKIKEIQSYNGVTTVAWIDNDSQLHQEIKELMQELQSILSELGLGDKVAFVDLDSLHMTVSDLISTKDKVVGVRQLEEISDATLNALSALKESGGIKMEVRGVSTLIPYGSVLIATVYPNTANDLDRLYQVRNAIQPVIKKELPPFIGHITLGYIVKPMTAEEYKKFIGIIGSYHEDILGILNINNLQIRNFRSMNDYDEPEHEFNLITGQPVVPKLDERISLEDQKNLVKMILENATVGKQKVPIDRRLIKVADINRAWKYLRKYGGFQVIYHPEDTGFTVDGDYEDIKIKPPIGEIERTPRVEPPIQWTRMEKSLQKHEKSSDDDTLLKKAEQNIEAIKKDFWSAKESAIFRLIKTETNREDIIPLLRGMLWDQRWYVHIAAIKILQAWGENISLNYGEKKTVYIGAWRKDVESSVYREIIARNTALHVDILDIPEYVYVKIRISDEDVWKVILAEDNYKVEFDKRWGEEAGKTTLDLIVKEIIPTVVDRASVSEAPGGIDMNQIDVNRQGEGVNINYGSEVLEPILNQPIDGFRPVIINLTPLPSLAPLLGLEPAEKTESVKISSL